jgi:hypothetical protein
VSPHLAPDRLSALAEGEEPSEREAEHLLECASCRDVLDDSPPLADAMRALRETPALPADRQRAVEQRLVASLAAAPRRRRPWALAAVPLALAAVWLLAPRWAAKRTPVEVPAPVSHAAAEVEAGARVETLQKGEDELLMLDGAATFRVRPLPPGHRFRVRMGGDEIEVKGTTFRLHGDAAGLREISVSEGLVEVRTRCCGTRSVGAGQRWVPSAEPTWGNQEAPDPLASGSAPAVSPPAPSAAVSSVDVDGLRRRGLAAFDAGQFSQAAALLQQAAALAPEAPWSRDVRTLAGAARVLAAPVGAVAGMGVGVVAFDKAAQRAAAMGDGPRAAAARLGAARSSKGEGRKGRFCALLGEGSLPASARTEISRECGR